MASQSSVPISFLSITENRKLCTENCLLITEDRQPSTNVLNIVLFEPEIHYNAGNVGRTCVALEAKLWLVRPLGFRLDDRHLHRAGLDYWEHLNWEAIDDWDALIRQFPEFQPWFFTKTASRLYTQVRYDPDDVLVFGSETRGLPPAILAAYPDRCLRIPMHRHVRSLNLAVSVGIAAYEAMRQITNGKS